MDAAATREPGTGGAAPPAPAGPPPLREPVLAGRFLGRAAAAAADALAAFLVEPSAAMALQDWFGPEALAALLAHDGTPAGRARAISRLEEAVDRDIAAIDRIVSAQLDAILAQERLRRLEGSWRGLAWIAARLPPAGARIRLRLLPLRWAELCRDLERAVEFDQSHLFRKIYEEEFGTPGGEPFGLICADFEVRPFPGPGSPQEDVAALSGLAGIAAAAFAPTIIAAHPALFGLGEHAELGAATDPTEPLRGSAAYRRWRLLQEREDARFLAVLAPRALARPPWPDHGARADGFRFLTDPGQPGARAWMSPVYPFAAVVLRAFAEWGWPADIRGAVVAEAPAGGVVTRLPEERLPTDPPGPSGRPPVEVALTDEQERQLVEAGLLPLVGLEGLPEAVFAAAPSLHRPPRMSGDQAASANANQRLSSQFNAILCVSRFAHCIKLMGRQMAGSFKTAEEIEGRLQEWLLGFASLGGSASGEGGARQPLRNAQVRVTERPDRPGSYGCVIHLQPHYQLDEVGAAFRLVADIDAPKAA